MPILDNPKHEAFAQAFVRGETAGSRARSYQAAGYECDDESARTCGARLAKSPDVMRRIVELKQEMQASEQEATERATARLALTKEKVLAELARIAFASILDYGEPDADEGFIVDLTALDRDKAAAIQEVVVTPVTGKDGKTRNRIRVKLAAKRDALVDLGRHFGLFVPGAETLEDQFEQLSEDELKTKIRAAVWELQQMGIDVAKEFGIEPLPGDDEPQPRLN